MGVEFGDTTGVWLGREDGGWELVEGVTHVELQAESPPAEDASAFANESGVTKLFSWVPTCPSGTHLQHSDLTCEEHEELSKPFQDFIESLFKAVFEEARRAATQMEHAIRALRESVSEEEYLDRLFRGDGAGGMRGIASWLAEPTQQTPIERALQILEPHLARESLYQPSTRMGRRVPALVHATAPVPEQQRTACTSTNRPAWQSPYGPPPRRR
ncbi:hypothetical protein ACFZCL_04285 [Streptomyces sp. NPDC008159]|uniref:hypothetical protein n=1 Tax=Streptomyces sp. NPDC008159 TaxID=3364817 RepID=UPI0036EB093F